MAQVSRATFATNLATLINDNTEKNVTPAEVRSVFTDLEDSAVWYDEGVLRGTTSNLTVGYTTTAYSNGTVTSGTVTLSLANGQVQTLTNNGAFTLNPPIGTGSMLLEITNGASAGAITTSGFTVVRGSFTTTNAAVFLCSVATIGARSYLVIN